MQRGSPQSPCWRPFQSEGKPALVYKEYRTTNFRFGCSLVSKRKVCTHSGNGFNPFVCHFLPYLNSLLHAITMVVCDTGGMSHPEARFCTSVSCTSGRSN